MFYIVHMQYKKSQTKLINIFFLKNHRNKHFKKLYILIRYSITWVSCMVFRYQSMTWIYFAEKARSGSPGVTWNVLSNTRYVRLQLFKDWKIAIDRPAKMSREHPTKIYVLIMTVLHLFCGKKFLKNLWKKQNAVCKTKMKTFLEKMNCVYFRIYHI